MVAIVTRAGKGSPLTHAELDGNFTNLKTAIENASVADAYGAAVLADAPLAYWRLDDAYGSSTFVDASGHGYALTPAAGGIPPVRGALRSPNGGRYFDSANYAAMPTALNTMFPLTSSFSVEAFYMLMSTPPTWRPVVCSAPAKGTDQYDLRLLASCASAGVAALAVGDANSNHYLATCPFSATVGMWYHILGTYDGTTIKLYVNGVLVASTAQSINIAGVTRPIQYIGRDGYDAATAMCIDEVALYNSTLSAARVAAHYAASFG